MVFKVQMSSVGRINSAMLATVIRVLIVAAVVGEIVVTPDNFHLYKYRNKMLEGKVLIMDTPTGKMLYVAFGLINERERLCTNQAKT